jgi:hypothetical protein
MNLMLGRIVAKSNVLTIMVEEPAGAAGPVETPEGGTTLVAPNLSQQYFLKRAGHGQYWIDGNFSGSLYEDLSVEILQNPLATVVRIRGRERHFFHPDLSANQILKVSTQFVLLRADGSALAPPTQITLTRLRGEVVADTNLRQLSIEEKLQVSGVKLSEVEGIQFLGQVLEKLVLGGKAWGRLDSENLSPLPSILTANSPEEGGPGDQAILKVGMTIEGAAKLFKHSCSGGQEYPDNCAHFLSDALILAGFSKLGAAHSCVSARCTKPGCSAVSKRPIRAKDIRCWFKENAKTTDTSVAKHSGFWAVYQERQADGQGHVVVLDANAWKFYGTGWFEAGTPDNWKHEYYQW